MSEFEARSRPTQRYTGFDVASQASDEMMRNNAGTSSGRVRTTTSGTIVRVNDGDTEMGDEKKSVQPLPIPGSEELKANNLLAAVATSAQSPADLPTPPDAQVLTTSTGDKMDTSVTGVTLAPLHSRILSPRVTTISSSHVSSGPASVTSSHWSPGRSTDPHLYSISSQPYVYSSVKPYLSTSFQTSAERGGASGSGGKFGSARDDENEDDDVFGNTSQGLGLISTGEPSPPRLRRSNDMDREDGDAAGVFSFSSPCFGPRSLEHSDVPPLSPPVMSDVQRQRVQRVMSPSWTAATLGQMTLNGASPESSSSLARRPVFGQSPRQASHLNNVSSIQSQSMPSHDYNMAQNRRLSFNRRPPATKSPKSYHGIGPSTLHPHSQFQRTSSEARARSRSRTRLAESGIPVTSHGPAGASAIDDDETDEEAMVMDREEEDDDATEDEMDQRPNRFTLQQQKALYAQDRFYDEANGQGKSIGGSIPLRRHPSGQATTMSASFERANSGLNRQALSERYASTSAHYAALGRHHPYASMSSAGASPSNPGVLSSYSPSSARISMGRRRSSFGKEGGEGGMKVGSPSQGGHVMAHHLSHSPRYGSSRHSSAYQEQQSQQYLPSPAYQHSSASHPGSSPESRNGMRVVSSTSGLHRQQGERGDGGLDDDEDDDDDEEEEDDEVGEQEEELEYNVHHLDNNGVQLHPLPQRKSTARPAKSPSRQAARASASAGGGEVDSSEMNEVTAIRERLGGAANCSAFISKLWYLMCRPQLYSRYIHWSESGDSVILSNDPDINNEFASEVLPKLFKHGNNASFVRQLNLYGFQRVPSSRLLDAAETKAAKEYSPGVNISTALQLYGPHSSFAHPRFKKDQEELLPSMKPRSSKKTKKGGVAGGRDSEPEDDYGM